MHMTGASPHGVTLVEQTLDAGFLNGVPARLVGDKAYEGVGLAGRRREAWGTEMIAHRIAVVESDPTRDSPIASAVLTTLEDRTSFAWLQSFRLLVLRYWPWSNSEASCSCLGIVEMAPHVFNGTG
mgnify:CR=1 FL=1